MYTHKHIQACKHTHTLHTQEYTHTHTHTQSLYFYSQISVSVKEKMHSNSEAIRKVRIGKWGQISVNAMNTIVVWLLLVLVDCWLPRCQRKHLPSECFIKACILFSRKSVMLNGTLRRSTLSSYLAKETSWIICHVTNAQTWTHTHTFDANDLKCVVCLYRPPLPSSPQHLFEALYGPQISIVEVMA